MKKSKVAKIVFMLIGIIAVFLPWFTMPMFGGFNGIQVKYGIGTLIAFIVLLAIELAKDKVEILNKFYTQTLYGLSSVAVLIAIAFILEVSSKANEADLFGNAMSISTGVIVTIIAAAGVMLSKTVIND